MHRKVRSRQIKGQGRPTLIPRSELLNFDVPLEDAGGEGDGVSLGLLHAFDALQSAPISRLTAQPSPLFTEQRVDPVRLDPALVESLRT